MLLNGRQTFNRAYFYQPERLIIDNRLGTSGEGASEVLPKCGEFIFIPGDVVSEQIIAAT